MLWDRNKTFGLRTSIIMDGCKATNAEKITRGGPSGVAAEHSHFLENRHMHGWPGPASKQVETCTQPLVHRSAEVEELSRYQFKYKHTAQTRPIWLAQPSGQPNPRR